VYRKGNTAGDPALHLLSKVSARLKWFDVADRTNFRGLEQENEVRVLENEVVKLARGKNFAAFTTILPSGMPMTHLMWVDASDDQVLLNTEIHRRKYKNVVADPRVVVTVIDASNPYHYVEVRGRVVEEVRGAEARTHIDQLAEKYTGAPYKPEIRSERVILKVEPERQLVH
jgi:PPOX class probable F420-dependent enzyme